MIIIIITTIMCSFFRSFFRSIRNYFFYNECHNYDAMELVLQLEKMLNNLIKANYKTWTDAIYAKCVASRIHLQLSAIDYMIGKDAINHPANSILLELYQCCGDDDFAVSMKSIIEKYKKEYNINCAPKTDYNVNPIVTDLINELSSEISNNSSDAIKSIIAKINFAIGDDPKHHFANYTLIGLSDDPTDAKRRIKRYSGIINK